MKLRYLISIIASMLVIAPLAYAGSKLSKSAVLLEINGGDTAFVLDKSGNKAWWLVGQCKRIIPMGSKEKQKNPNNSMTSEVVSEQAQIGNRQVILKQQFRFTQASTSGPFSVEVYNSLRRGWSPVPVETIDNCAQDASCRRRMEVPEC